MSDTLKDRERGEEFRFEMSQELQFKIEARRNRLLGEWLASKFGFTSDDAAALGWFTREEVAAEQPGIVTPLVLHVIDRATALREAGCLDIDQEVAQLHSVASK